MQKCAYGIPVIEPQNCSHCIPHISDLQRNDIDIKSVKKKEIKLKFQRIIFLARNKLKTADILLEFTSNERPQSTQSNKEENLK